VREQRRPRRPRPGAEHGRVARRRPGDAQGDHRGPARGDGGRALRGDLGAHHRCPGQAALTGGAGGAAPAPPTRAAAPRPRAARPTRGWAGRHLGPRFGKAEAWILLDTPGEGTEPAYAGIGFLPGTDRGWFAGAVRRHDNPRLRDTLHRTDVHPGEVYVAHAG